MLHVKSIEQFGAVSREVVLEMAEGAIAESGVDFSIAVSGVAGPGGGTSEKPVGTVHLAFAARNKPSVAYVLALQGTRESIRVQTSVAALLLGRELFEAFECGNSRIDLSNSGFAPLLK